MTQPSFSSRLSQFSEDVKLRRLANTTTVANLMGPGPEAPPPEPPPANKDFLGLDAWAGEQGISPTTALVLMAVTLAHIAGPTLTWEGAHGLNGMSPPSLLGAESDGLLKTALARLTANLVTKQQRLLQGSQEFPISDVNTEFHKVSPAGNAMYEELKKFQNPPTGYFDYQPEHQLDEMMALGDRTIHRENLVHPLVLLESLPSGPLEPLLGSCNHGHGFLAGATEQLPTDKSVRNRRLDDLLRLIDGVVIHPAQPSVIRAKTLRLGGLFRFRQQDLHWLFDHRRDVLRKMIPVASNPPHLEAPFDFKPEAARDFQNRFTQTASIVLARRRAFTPTGPGFTSDEARRDYMIRRRQHLVLSANDPVDLTSVPDLIIWFLLLVGRDKADELTLVDLAIRSTETLRGEACRAFTLHDEMELGRSRHENATKMLRRLAEQGPMKRHLLVRVFAQQSLEIHGPVIDALLAHGFISEDHERRLNVGPQPAARLNVGHMIGN
jgi:hypothetical protein